MAETKRHSIGGRTSTPKPTSRPSTTSGPGDFDMSKAIGARVKVVTAAPSLTLEGTLYTACPLTNLVAIDTSNSSTTSQLPSSSNQTGNFHVIPISRIQSFSIISLSESSPLASESGNVGFASAQPPISKIDLKALKAREEAAIRKIKERDAMLGKGVTKEAQEIFDAMARTLPCRWHETSIIVNDAVIISSPYTPDNCSAPKEQQNALTRVKKVLENERRRLAQKAAAAPKVGGPATSSPTPRKGG